MMRPYTSKLAQQRFLVATLALWLLPLLVVTVMVVAKSKRTVTPVYSDAVRHWWAGESLYEGASGRNYHYLPQFAVLFTPFQALPQPFGDVAWRWLSLGLLIGSFWRFSRLIGRADKGRVFFWSSFVAFLLSLDALRNGQANVMFAALTVLAVTCMVEEHWWSATTAVVVAMMIKPLAVALLLLAPVIYRKLIWRLGVGVVALFVFPFLFANPDYVWSQYLQAAEHLRGRSLVSEHRFADIGGVLRTLHLHISGTASQLLRVVAGGATLCLWWFGAKRLPEPFRGLFLLILFTGYLIVFNPMTEVNGYVIVAPALGFVAAMMGCVFVRKPIAWSVSAMAFSMAILPEALRRPFGNSFALWWHPLVTLVFLTLVMWLVFASTTLTSALEQKAGAKKPGDVIAAGRG